MSRTLDRIAKVLNQAERASTPEEAATFMAKAQQMATLASIDLAVARSHTINKETREQVVKNRQVTVNSYDRKYNRDHFMDLFLGIAEANDVQCTIGGGSYSAYATGFPSDIEVAEALFASLAIQMVTDCEKAMAGHAHEELRNEIKRIRVPIENDADRAWGEWDGSGYYDDWDGGKNPPPKTKLVPVLDEEGNPVYEKRWFTVTDGRTYRANFYAGFAHATRIRMMSARAEARIQAGFEEESSGVALVLADKKKEVDSAYDEVLDQLKQLNPRGLGSYKGGSVSEYDHRGRSDGAESARNAKYDNDGNSVGASNRKELS